MCNPISLFVILLPLFLEVNMYPLDHVGAFSYQTLQKGQQILRKKGLKSLKV